MILIDLRMKMFAFLPREQKAILDGRLLCISRHIYWPAASWPTRDPKKRAGHGGFLLADIELRDRLAVWGSQSAEDTVFLVFRLNKTGDVSINLHSGAFV